MSLRSLPRTHAAFLVLLALTALAHASARGSGDGRRTATEAEFGADGRMLVFATEPGPSGAVELWGVPCGGGAPRWLGGPLEARVGRPWAVAPGGERVVFVARGLFSATLDGRAPAVRLGPTAEDAWVDDFALSADGARVVYRAGAADESAGLYSAWSDGRAGSVELVPPNRRGEVRRGYALDARGMQVVFCSLHEDGASARLYRVAVDGGRAVALTPPHMAVNDFRLGAEGTRALFRCENRRTGRLELFTVPVDGSQGPVQLCDALEPEADVSSFALSPDGGWVVFLSDRGRNGRNDLLAARSDASAAPVCLSAALGAEGVVTSGFQLEPGSRRVVYEVEREAGAPRELFASALDGRGEPVRLDAPDPSGGRLGWVGLGPDGDQVLYHVQHGERDGTLWRVSMDEPARRTELAVLHSPTAFQLAPDGRRVLYLERGSELRACALDGGTAPAVLRAGCGASAFRFSPDGSWVLERTAASALDGAQASQLLRLSSDGGAAPLLLAGTGPARLAPSPTQTVSAAAGGTGGRSSLSGDVGFRDFSFGTTGSSTPTGEKPECKLWWNDGFWWGSLYNDAAGDYHIYGLDPSTQRWLDTGTVLDDRGSTKADVLWDAASQKLYLASHIFSTNAQPTASNWGRLFRYSYSSADKRYTPDAGFPVDITRGNAEALTLAKDSTGRLWATWVEAARVMINHSLASDTQWGTPSVLPVEPSSVALTSDDISALIAFGGNKVGVMWSNQLTSNTYFVVHRDEDPDTVWQAEELVIPDANCSGTCADDLFSLKTDAAGRVLVALKTSLSGPEDPLMLVSVRSPSGGWVSRVFGRVQDHHTRPVLLFDEHNGKVYVFATTPENGGAIYYKCAPLADLQFPVGLGTPFIQNGVDVGINNATSTKQNLDGTTGLVVLASDQETRFYLHNVLDLGPAANPPTITSFSPSSGPVGTHVVIAGTNLTGATSLRFNGTAAGFSVVSATRIDATVPSGATTGKLTVTTPGGTATSANSFTVTQQGPTITSFSPSSGPVGTNVVITGTDFGGATSVRFNGTAAGFSVVSSTRIDATVPGGATTGKLTVTTPGGTATSANSFTVTQQGPTITSFSPSSGPVGTNVVITGTDFGGATSVRFNGTAAGFSVVSSTRIDATVPSGATTGKLTVTTPSGTATSASAFVVTHPPVLQAFTPSIGIVATPVTIHGSRFSGATRVEFNGRSATLFTVVDDGTILTFVPLGATTGKLSVTTAEGTGSSASDFTVIGL